MPGLLKLFQEFPAVQSRGEELHMTDALYAALPSIDFSRQVLSTETQRLIVHSLGPVTWSDLGDCERALAALSREGMQPDWARTWRAAKPPTPARRPAALAALGWSWFAVELSGLMSFEVLNLTLVLLRRCTGWEGSKVTPLSRLRILFPRVEAILSGL
jgi:hypothetical protein